MTTTGWAPPPSALLSAVPFGLLPACRRCCTAAPPAPVAKQSSKAADDLSDDYCGAECPMEQPAVSTPWPVVFSFQTHSAKLEPSATAAQTNTLFENSNTNFQDHLGRPARGCRLPPTPRSRRRRPLHPLQDCWQWQTHAAWKAPCSNDSRASAPNPKP